MKTETTLRSALVALCCGLALTACHNDEEPGVDLSKPIQLSFSPAQMGAESRATIAVTDAAFEDGDQVGVFMDDTGYSNELFTLNGTAWSGPTMYWPDAYTYTFCAYYPYQENVTDETAVPVSLPANQNGADILTDIDYMWVTEDRAASNGTVNMTLNHKMSLLKLDVEAGADMSLSEIMGMEASILGSIPSTGTWNLTTGTVTITTGSQSHTAITPYRVDNSTSLTYYALVMPGTTFAEGAKFFSLTDAGDTTYSYYLDTTDGNGITAVESKYCNISLKVNRSGISVTGFEVGNWAIGQAESGMVNME